MIITTEIGVEYERGKSRQIPFTNEIYVKVSTCLAVDRWLDAGAQSFYTNTTRPRDNNNNKKKKREAIEKSK